MAEVEQMPREASLSPADSPDDTLGPAPPAVDTATPAEDETALAVTKADPVSQGNKTVARTETTANGERIEYYINADGKKVKRIIRKKRRPARPQVDPAEFKSEPPPQTGTIFNIWYNKWSGGDREDSYLSKTHAKGRCNVALDSGYTRADSVAGSYFCLFFARGVCPKGRDCEYLHRLPDEYRDLYSGNVDCFGREKHSDYRDDMGGVGSFMRQNRTLYIGRIHPTDDVEEVISRHFQEWGSIERIRCLPTRGVAFVTYRTEELAQFAKEAMAHQSLDNEEILNVRWATQDPNPQAQKREARNIEEQAADAIRRALPAEFVKQLEGKGVDGEEARKRRKVDGTFGLDGYTVSDELWLANSRAELRGVEGGISGALEGAAQPKMLTNGNGTDAPSVGILGASTLAALKGYKAAPQSKQGGGPLVGYGSDSDED